MKEHAIPEEIQAGLQTPFLVIYLDRVRENIGRVLQAAGGDPGRWRPHLKSTKLPLIWQELIDQGLRSFKCATTREAGCLLEAAQASGLVEIDLLVAHPLSPPGRERLSGLAREYPQARISLACDDPLVAEELDEHLGIWADLNGGMDRTGIPLEEGQKVLEFCRRAGSRLQGLHLYEGHITGGTPASRHERCHQLYERLLDRMAALGEAGIVPGRLVTSGTPAFLHALTFPGFDPAWHQVSPGTVILHDQRSRDNLPELDLVPAALLFARVVSHPAPGVITLDAGSKSISADAGDPCAVPVDHPELAVRSPSEEHLPLSCSSGEGPDRGEVVPLLPRHICTTVNLADEAVVMDGGRFLGVVPLAARGHELLT